MRRIFFSPADPTRPRPFWRAIVHGGAWIPVVLLLMLPLFGLDELLGGAALSDPDDEDAHVVFTFAMWGTALIATRFLARHMDARPIADFGLRLDRQWGRDYLAGLAIGALPMAAIFLVLYAGGWIVVDAVQLTTAIFIGLLVDLIAHFGVGFGEELTSRGPLMLNLEETFRFSRLHPIVPAFLAIAITSTMFGLMHAGNNHASAISNVNLIFAGVALAIPVLLTRQLGISMGAHTSWNFVQGAIFGFPVSGHVLVTPVIDSREVGPDVLTGGAFGPEAGVLSLAGDALIIALTILYVKKTRGRVAILPPPELPPQTKTAGESEQLSPADEIEIPSPS
jgi:hypothetical protein